MNIYEDARPVGGAARAAPVVAPAAPKVAPVWGFAIAVLVWVAAVFWPALRFDAIDMDDDIYVSQNPWVQKGLSAETVRWALTTTRGSYWMPASWISYLCDTTCWGSAPSSYRRTNILLHAASAAILFLLLVRATGAIGRSMLVALLFGMHPLRIESVVWIAERKDVLSVFFWMLTMLAYVQQVKTEKPLWSRAVFAGFLLSLLSKPTAILLPAALLLFDYWPLGRMTTWKDAVDRVREKWHLLATSGVFFVLTWYTLSLHGSTWSLSRYPFLWRLAHVPIIYLQWLIRTVWPANLAVAYPPPPHVSIVALVAGLAVLIGVTAAVLRFARRQPVMAMGWFWFLLMALPFSGLTRVGLASHASDRFTYLSQLGLVLLAVWGAWSLLGRLGRNSAKLGFALGTVLVVLSIMSARSQLGFWVDSEHLFQRALAVTGPNAVARQGVGRALEARGKLADALLQYETAVKIDPQFADGFVGMSDVFVRMGRYEEAQDACEKALHFAPGAGRNHSNYGLMLFRDGKYEEALDQFRQAVRLDSELTDARFNLALALYHLRQTEEAARHLVMLTMLDPADAPAQFLLGRVLLAQNAEQAAGARFEKAWRLKPGNAEYASAAAVSAHKQGNTQEAIRRLRESLNRNPDSLELLNNLAWMLATGQGLEAAARQEAVAFAERAVTVGGAGDPNTMDTLAVASAASGDLARAIEAEQAAVSLAARAGQSELETRFRQRLEQFKKAAESPAK